MRSLNVGWHVKTLRSQIHYANEEGMSDVADKLMTLADNIEANMPKEDGSDMENTEIKPALSADEWKAGGTPWEAGWRFRGGATQFQVEVLRDNGAFGTEVELKGRHGLAALALFGQRFGFTREDVNALLVVDAASENDALRDLAHRIEALLPPEK